MKVFHWILGTGSLQFDMGLILVAQQQVEMSLVKKHGCLHIKHSHNELHVMDCFGVKQLIPSGSYLVFITVPSGAMPSGNKHR